MTKLNKEITIEMIGKSPRDGTISINQVEIMARKAGESKTGPENKLLVSHFCPRGFTGF